MSGITEREHEALRWLNGRNDYYVGWDDFRAEFPDVEAPLVGVTFKYDVENKQSLVPIRDVRQAIKYENTLD